MDASINKVIRDVEAVLKDKCTYYLIVVTDGEKVNHVYNSKLMAHSMCHQISTDIERDWRAEPTSVIGEEHDA